MPSKKKFFCAYCGNGNDGSLVYCMAVNAWFCNGTGPNNSKARSHAVEHLKRAGGAHLCRVHDCRKSLFKQSEIKCDKCGSCNVFHLGIQHNPTGRNQRFLCRLTCEEKPPSQVSPKKLKKFAWEPVIVDGKFHRLIAKADEELNQELDVTMAVINEKEREWLPHRPSDGVDLATLEKNIHLPDKKPVRFKNCNEYVNIGRNFLRLEQKANEAEMKKREKEGNVTVTWLPAINDRDDEIRASFKLRQMTQGHRLGPGNSVTMSLCNNTWQSRATVIRVADDVTVVLKKTKKTPVQTRHGFIISWSMSDVPYKRMFNALNTLEKSGKNTAVNKAILGQETQRLNFPIPENFSSAPGLPLLNNSQKDAVRYALERTVSVIEAPPGTGKTTMAAFLAYHLVQSGDAPILVCAPSNIAADNLASALAKTGLDGVIRMYARWREEDPNYEAADSAVNSMALHRIVRSFDSSERKKKIRQLEDQILKCASVICCTCIAAGDPRLNKIAFNASIIDECSQASENECLVPIQRGKIKQLVLIGDRKQLGPNVVSKKARKANFSKSLFERLGEIHGSVSLNMQYRMHPAISAFPSATFYDGKLLDGISAVERTPLFDDEVGAIFPKRDLPIVFIKSASPSKREEISSSATSYLNRHECKLVHEVLCRLFEYDVEPSQIGVITMYEGQREYLSAYLATLERQSDGDGKECGFASAVDGDDDNNWVDYCQRVEIKTVDGYQGRENDYIVISCVRSNARKCVGFLSDARRVNVALTRARNGLVIIGDPKTLSNSSEWQRLINYYKKQGTLIASLPGYNAD